MQVEHASQQRRMQKTANHDARATADSVANVSPMRTGALFPACCCLTLCCLCHSLLIDHQLQKIGWLTVTDHHGNTELLLYVKDANSDCASLHLTLEMKDSLLSFTARGGLSTCWRPVTSLNVADFPKCLTICSVLLTMCLCCQSHRGKKSKGFIFFVNGICWDDINHSDSEPSTHKWMRALNTRIVKGPLFLITAVISDNRSKAN